MTELTLETLRSELDPLNTKIDAMADDIKAMRAQLTIIGKAIEVLQRDNRMAKAAVNDFARTNVTTGEIEAVHDDLQRVIARQDNLETRLLVLEERKP